MIGIEAHYGCDLDRVLDTGHRVSPERVDPAPALGVWWNTDPGSCGVQRAELRMHKGAVRVRITGTGPGHEQHDWGETTVDRVYTDGPGSGSVCGYTAEFDLGHARTRLQANLNHGLTVIAAFTTFTDGSGRAGYLSREFFYRGAAS